MSDRELQGLPASNAALSPGAADAIPTAAAAAPEGTLKLVCRKCTRTEYFHGVNRGVCSIRAQAAGWKFTLDRGEICPRCPAGRAELPPPPEGTLKLTCSQCGGVEPFRGTNQAEAVMRAQSAGWRLLPNGQVCARCQAPPQTAPKSKRTRHAAGF